MRTSFGRNWRSIVVVIGVLGAMAALVAGCGGSTAAGTAQPTATTAAPQPTTSTAQPTATTGGAGSGGATISMGSGHFTGNTTVTIKAGQSVVFDDSAGGPHDLVIGTHGVPSPETGAPSQLNSTSGVSFGGGDTATVAFPNAGTFNITCTFHPSMQATVVVTP